jgi:hypothetical protein
LHDPFSSPAAALSSLFELSGYKRRAILNAPELRVKRIQRRKTSQNRQRPNAMAVADPAML